MLVTAWEHGQRRILSSAVVMSTARRGRHGADKLVRKIRSEKCYFFFLFLMLS
jgi:hypothetical protein